MVNQNIKFFVIYTTVLVLVVNVSLSSAQEFNEELLSFIKGISKNKVPHSKKISEVYLKYKVFTIIKTFDKEIFTNLDPEDNTPYKLQAEALDNLASLYKSHIEGNYKTAKEESIFSKLSEYELPKITSIAIKTYNLICNSVISRSTVELYLANLTKMLFYTGNNKLYDLLPLISELANKIEISNDSELDSYIYFVDTCGRIMIKLYTKSNLKFKTFVNKFIEEILSISKEKAYDSNYKLTSKLKELYSKILYAKNDFESSEEQMYEASIAMSERFTNNKTNARVELKYLTEAERLILKASKINFDHAIDFEDKYINDLDDIRKGIVEFSLNVVKYLEETDGSDFVYLDFLKDRLFFAYKAYDTFQLISNTQTTEEDIKELKEIKIKCVKVLTENLEKAMKFDYLDIQTKSEYYDYDDLANEFTDIFVNGYKITKDEKYLTHSESIVESVLSYIKDEINQTNEETDFCKNSSCESAEANCFQFLGEKHRLYGETMLKYSEVLKIKNYLIEKIKFYQADAYNNFSTAVNYFVRAELLDDLDVRSKMELVLNKMIFMIESSKKIKNLK